MLKALEIKIKKGFDSGEYYLNEDILWLYISVKDPTTVREKGIEKSLFLYSAF